MKQLKNKALSDFGDVLTPQDIADYLQVSRETIYTLLRLKQEHGGIPNFKVNPLTKKSGRRIKKREFVAWLEMRGESIAN